MLREAKHSVISKNTFFITKNKFLCNNMTGQHFPVIYGLYLCACDTKHTHFYCVYLVKLFT